MGRELQREGERKQGKQIEGYNERNESKRNRKTGRERDTNKEIKIHAGEVLIKLLFQSHST